MYILICSKCRSEIAINDGELEAYDIDCDCGNNVTASSPISTWGYPQYVAEPELNKPHKS